MNRINPFVLMEQGYALLFSSEQAAADRHTINDLVLREAADNPLRTELAALCQSYYMFRFLHNLDSDPEENTLLGDYFFSIFTQLAAIFDDTALVDAFALRLAQECRGEKCDSYTDFVTNICKGSY